MKGKAYNSPSFCSIEEEKRIEVLIENLIRCIANTQVKVLTTEAAVDKSVQKVNQLADRCEILETRQQEILKKIAQLEHRLDSFGYMTMPIYPM